MKAVLLIALVISIIFAGSNVAFANPENWTEVTRFTGSGNEQYTTNYYTCGHVEWRIRWEYTPDSQYPEFAMFSVFTYPEGEDVMFIDTIMKSGGDDTSGASYIHNDAGTFYSTINVANTESYTIIIEQDVDSVPEATTFGILILLIVSSSVGILAYRRRHHPQS